MIVQLEGELSAQTLQDSVQVTMALERNETRLLAITRSLHQNLHPDIAVAEAPIIRGLDKMRMDIFHDFTGLPADKDVAGAGSIFTLAQFNIKVHAPRDTATAGFGN